MPDGTRSTAGGSWRPSRPRAGGDGAPRAATDIPTSNVHGCAIVFEGGGYRGAYTAGMVNLLLERGIYFDYACGVSAGASHAINYVSRDQARVRMAFAAIDGNEPVGGIGSLVRGRGYFNADYLYEGCIRDGFCPFDWETFVANPARIRIQAFDRDSGQTVTFGKEDMPDVWRMINSVRASSTIPLAMNPLPLDGRTLYDGGLGTGAGIPLQLAIDDGFERFVMLATRPRRYRKKPTTPVQRFILSRLFADHRQLLEAIVTRPERYNDELDRLAVLEREGRALVIRPEVMPVSNGTLDTPRLEEAYALGHAQLEREMGRLREFVGL